VVFQSELMELNNLCLLRIAIVWREKIGSVARTLLQILLSYSHFIGATISLSESTAALTSIFSPLSYYRAISNPVPAIPAKSMPINTPVCCPFGYGHCKITSHTSMSIVNTSIL
jgi:hypothetical protein